MTPVELAGATSTDNGDLSRSPSGGQDETAIEGEFMAYVRDLGDGRRALDCMVEGIHCGACINRIERAFQGVKGVEKARVNFSTRRLALVWTGAAENANTLCEKVHALGFGLVPYDPTR